MAVLWAGWRYAKASPEVIAEDPEDPEESLIVIEK